MAARASNNTPPSLRKVWAEQETFGRAATASSSIMTSARAIVSHHPLADGGWKIEDVDLRPLGEGELLVEMVATGVCHTDALIGSLPDGVAPMAFYPRVLGHEGSGYVKDVGPAVTVAQPGDPVLLSFSYCNQCEVCKAGHYSNCNAFNDINFGPQSGFQLKDGKNCGGQFFGQSSFAALSIVRQCSVVNAKGLIKDKKELQLFSPLGCGIQTGSGTVINVAQAGPKDAICIMGLGGVGLSAVMAAKIQGCRKIIGIDKVASRLELATELGCTHTVDGSKLGDKSLEDAVRELTEDVGPSICIDTTGAPPLIEAGCKMIRNRGKYIQVGSASFAVMLDHVNVFEFMSAGKQFIGAIEGSATPTEYVPKMIQWYREGNFPFDKLMKFFPADDFAQGLHEMHTGETIKPILMWS
ncbi:NAD(P)-binding protein [Polychaeton citri CBS 116435]|uniref:NAD(P)-binding protein n=1 Tax=Polychaeton citri CBS 116435 TaxID=1314669 RepID=A0A9P4Q6I6_9PEZI|nr:NAD(P)-binding protein [Polychaeton citri CBS 116435]